MRRLGMCIGASAASIATVQAIALWGWWTFFPGSAVVFLLFAFAAVGDMPIDDPDWQADLGEDPVTDHRGDVVVLDDWRGGAA